jgi:hypothetical protein
MAVTFLLLFHSLPHYLPIQLPLFCQSFCVLLAVGKDILSGVAVRLQRPIVR